MRMNEPSAYKVVTVGDQEQEVHLVVPHYVSAQEVYLSEAGISDEPYECVCECPLFDDAKLIAKLLTKYQETLEVLQ